MYMFLHEDIYIYAHKYLRTHVIMYVYLTIFDHLANPPNGKGFPII